MGIQQRNLGDITRCEGATWLCLPTRQARYVLPRELDAMQHVLHITHLTVADLDFSDPVAIDTLRRHLVLLAVIEDRQRAPGAPEGPLARFTRHLLRATHGSKLDV